ncbi:MAG: hypothetical protein LBK95_17170, partial [Bifidobacteriaceae bacterium]|nr:hypothetical protein [Bifidobacteriaceae bacterium]
MSANASHVPAKIGIGALALALATFGLSAGPGSPASAAEVPEAVVAEAAGVLPVVARPAAMGGFASVQVNQWFNCYVEIEGDSSPEFYGGWACGTFVAYDGILYAPRDVPAAMLSRSPFTPITCSSPAPTPPVDSSQLRHCVSLGTTGITLEQVDTWVLGGTAITTRVILHGTPDEGTLIVYRAGDCYVADNDFGTGMVNTARRTASCVSQETGRVQQWETSPLSPHATLAEGYFADLWSWINRQQPFSGQHTTTYHDNAAGLSWQIDLSVYNGAGISSRMIFTPEANATDPDGDGLPDWWEMGCYDADSDGDCQADSGDVMLAEMGADPDVPDVFLEVDWMERPDTRGSFLWFNWGERPISLRPGDGARDTVQEAFWDQGINLHIDAGPDSIMDYRTDRTWGALSDGGPVEYSTEEVVPVDDSGERNWHRFDGLYSRWGAGSPFQVARREVFHYGVAVMTPAIDSSGTWSGIARVSDSFGHRAGDPAFHRGGQFFAFQSYDPDNAIAGMLRDNETALAGTLMHELGHTLGLGHGGGDHDNFKPNHLSIMSYSFQLDGLAWPAGRIDYSDRELAPLDETALDETAGLGVFDGWTGTRWFCPGGRFVQDVPLSGQFNWNCIDGIDAGTVSVDLNGNAVQTVLAGFDDWDHLVFDGGSIGAFG